MPIQLDDANSRARLQARIAAAGVREAALSGKADLALAIHVVHEVPYPRQFLTTCRTVLKPGGRLLLIEPKGHVSDEEFQETKDLAFDVGFTECDKLQLRKSHALVLEAPTTG